MEKNIRLVNIYLKIHNKRPLTMDDLGYLAKYDPECFEKTCENVVYNIPETKTIMKPAEEETEKQPEKENTETPKKEKTNKIDKILENIKRLAHEELPIADIDVEKVINLLGNLYMELLFPHNDKETFINASEEEHTSLFDKKV